MDLLCRIPCPTCGYTIDLLETSLKEIVQARRLPRTGEPFLMFVCKECKVAFTYNYQQQVIGAAIPEGAQTRLFRSQTWFSVVAGCNHYDHDEECDDSLVELIAIRPAGVSAKSVVETDMPAWNLSKIRCTNGHSMLTPYSTKAYEHLDTLDLQVDGG